MIVEGLRRLHLYLSLHQTRSESIADVHVFAKCFVCCQEDEELGRQVFVSAVRGSCAHRRPGRIDKLSCYYSSDLSPLGIRIPLLRDLGNRFWSICWVVQVESCVMLERQKKSQLHPTITHQSLETIVTTQQLETIVANTLHSP